MSEELSEKHRAKHLLRLGETQSAGGSADLCIGFTFAIQEQLVVGVQGPLASKQGLSQVPVTSW